MEDDMINGKVTDIEKRIFIDNFMKDLPHLEEMAEGAAKIILIYYKEFQKCEAIPDEYAPMMAVQAGMTQIFGK
ncbi:hypothetical protein QJV45_02000 [Listeria booriae]|uniref:hypothetical protein n=2 Tax=Listeria booriae TaxID=1552123 RepID=UPI0028803695|nr:hypothetical protein [Listeria booriae]MDT0109213.1 hypothetical protein [Listeria booriae]